jgi:hypothetical protein
LGRRHRQRAPNVIAAVVEILKKLVMVLILAVTPLAASMGRG